ncbi:MAG: hypothetical protein IT320_16750 [Anaerolineae bacterium]|nr:hypothetical protein [Anaerolineae bacterium]
MIGAVLLLCGGLAQIALAQAVDPLVELPTVEVVPLTLPPPDLVLPTDVPILTEPTLPPVVPTLPPPADVPIEGEPTLPPATIAPELPPAPTLAPTETAVPLPSPTVLAPASIFLTPDSLGEGESDVLSLTLSAVALANARQLTIICQVDPGRLRAVGLEAGDMLSVEGVAVIDYGFQPDA